MAKPVKFNLVGALALPMSVVNANSLEQQIDKLYDLADSGKYNRITSQSYLRLAKKLSSRLKTSNPKRKNPSTKGFIKCDGVRIRNGKIQLLNPGIYRIELMRIRLDRQGYSSFGKYFGIGAPVYHAEGQNLDQYLRANRIKEAKEKIIKYTKARVGPWEGKQIVFSRVN